MEENSHRGHSDHDSHFDHDGGLTPAQITFRKGFRPLHEYDQYFRHSTLVSKVDIEFVIRYYMSKPTRTP